MPKNSLATTYQAYSVYPKLRQQLHWTFSTRRDITINCWHARKRKPWKTIGQNSFRQSDPMPWLCSGTIISSFQSNCRSIVDCHISPGTWKAFFQKFHMDASVENGCPSQTIENLPMWAPVTMTLASLFTCIKTFDWVQRSGALQSLSLYIKKGEGLDLDL